jgi:hypothetical protein
MLRCTEWAASDGLLALSKTPARGLVSFRSQTGVPPEMISGSFLARDGSGRFGQSAMPKATYDGLTINPV